MDLSIVILNYKSKGFALNCIKSIKEADFGKLKYEIIVVDNNSDDAIGEILAWQYPDIKFFQNKENLGMGGGNNIGIRQAAGNYVVIMNPDTIAFNDTFQILYNYMEANKQVGAVGPLQYNPDKTTQDSCYRWYNFLTPIYRRTPLGKFNWGRRDNDRVLMKDFKRDKIIEVDWLLGSFLFCRHEALKQIGFFDEKYFMYFEDTDICRRFWQKSWKVVYDPEAKIIHNHGRKSAETPWYLAFNNTASRHHIASWLKYFRKWGLRNPKSVN